MEMNARYPAGDEMLSVNIAAQLAKFGADRWTESVYEGGIGRSIGVYGTNHPRNCSIESYSTAIGDIKASVSREYCPCLDAKGKLPEGKLPEEYVLEVHNGTTGRSFRGDHVKALFNQVQSSRKAHLEAKKRREEEEFADRLRIFARNG